MRHCDDRGRSRTPMQRARRRSRCALDCRRHRLAQEGLALCRRRASILRGARKTGQLSEPGLADASGRGGSGSDRVAAVLAGKAGPRIQHGVPKLACQTTSGFDPEWQTAYPVSRSCSSTKIQTHRRASTNPRHAFRVKPTRCQARGGTRPARGAHCYLAARHQRHAVWPLCDDTRASR